METDIQRLIDECHDISHTALLGCQAQTYEQIDALLDKIQGFIPYLSHELASAIKTIITRIHDALQVNDLNTISDCLVYDMKNLLLSLKQS